MLKELDIASNSITNEVRSNEDCKAFEVKQSFNLLKNLDQQRWINEHISGS